MIKRFVIYLPWVVAAFAGGAMLTGGLLSGREAREVVPWVLQQLAFPVVGAIVASRRPRMRIGWLLLAISLLLGVQGLAVLTYADSALGPDVGLPDRVMLWVAVVVSVPWLGLFPFLILLFPRDELPSPRWRLPARAGAVLLALLTLAWAIRPTLQMSDEGAWVANPLGVRPLGGFIEAVIPLLTIPLTVLLLAAIGNLVWRFFRARGDERQQLKWFAYGAAAFPVLMLLRFLSGNELWGSLAFSVGMAGMAAGIGISVLKYRLYDIDLVISKTVVFAGLAGLITVVYVGIVVGVGSLIGAGEEPNLGLPIVATAVVAVAFQPARERLNRMANRLVYGRRATPYEVLSRFSAQVGETVATEQTLEHMARLLAESTGAARAQVWLKAGERMRSAAGWPAEAVPELAAVVNTDGSLPEFAEVDLAVPVSHDGQLLGALTITKKRGEPITPTERSLIEDLAAQAGLVLRNVSLTTELRARLEELRDSRRRLVEAQDGERRRLERDLHDGAQQQLVALKIKLNLARRLAERDGATQAAQLVDQLTAETDEAVEALRELAHGIYPPLLAAEGLAGALRARAAKAPLPVAIEVDGVGRYSQEVEAAVYFSVLEAIQNAVKYANASRLTLRLAQSDGQLSFHMADDGVGFDPATTPRGHGLTNMTDRLDALGGQLTISSFPGEGTTMTGQVPTARIAPLSATS